MATTKTLRTKTFSKSRERGFTLLEILIVIGVIAAVMAYGVPRMNLKNGNIKQVARNLAVVTREVRNQARLKGRTFRIAFKMSEGKDPASYWVESAEGLKIPSREDIEKEKFQVSMDKKPDPFQRDEGLLKKEKELPPGLFIGQIETAHSADPETSGVAYIYFSPEGLVEKSAIQITNRQQLTWTLIVNPLTGHADIVEKAISLKDAKRD